MIKFFLGIFLLVLLYSCKKDTLLTVKPYFKFSIDGIEYSTDSCSASLYVSNNIAKVDIVGRGDKFYVSVFAEHFGDTGYIHHFSDTTIQNNNSHTEFNFINYQLGLNTEGVYGNFNNPRLFFSIDEKTDKYLTGRVFGQLSRNTFGYNSGFLGFVQVVNGQYKIPYRQ